MGFTEAHAFTAKWEGHLVDHPADPGGLTNYGVSLRFLKAAGHDVDNDGDVDTDDVRALTPEFAAALFKEHFWTRSNLGDFPSLTAVVTYDAGVNTGTGQAIKFLQASCNFYPGECLSVDGRLGPKTRARVAAIAKQPQGDLALAARCIRARKSYYARLADSRPKLAVFLKGWLNRCTALEKYLQELAGCAE